MFDWLNHLVSDSPLSYLIILGLTVADITGIVPAETVIVTSTLLALHGGLLVVAVGITAVVGALIGDNILYALGRWVGTPVADRMFRGETSRRRLEWARRNMRRYSLTLIVVGRLIPMGRTAVMLAAGLLDVPYRRFITADVPSVLLWGLYWVGLPAVLGQAISGNPWLTLVISVGVATITGGVAELVRRRTERRRAHPE